MVVTYAAAITVGVTIITLAGLVIVKDIAVVIVVFVVTAIVAATVVAIVQTAPKDADPRTRLQPTRAAWAAMQFQSC